MTDKQGDLLLGLSRSMEKSLASIEKSLAKGKDGGGKASSKEAPEKGSGSGAPIGAGMLALSTATVVFNTSKGKALVSFTNDLVKVVSKIDPLKAEAFGQFAEGVGSSINAIIEMVSPGKLLKLIIGSKILFGGKKPLLTTIIQGISNSFNDVDPKQIKKGGEAIDVLAGGISKLVKAFALMALIGVMAPLVAIGALVTWALLKVFKNIGDHAKSYSAGGKALQHLGKGLVLFSAGLASLMLVILIVTPAKIIAGVLVLIAFALVFALMGKADRQIENGGRSVAYMGLALFLFSMALATYMLVLLLASPELVMKGILVLGALAATFALIGFLDKKGFIKSGAMAVMEMGAALFEFSIGLIVFAIAMLIMDPSTIILGPLIIVGIGGAMALVGLMNKSGQVTSGATAMIEVGFALMSIAGGILLFGLAIKGLQAIFGDDLPIAGAIAGAILLGLGVAFMLIGLMAGAIAPGAAAMITVGFALMSISAGILIFGLAIKALQGIFGEDLMEAGKIAGGILLGLGVAFGAIGLLAIFIIPGAVAGILMGVALLTLSLGIWTFGNTLEGLYEKNLIDDEGKLKGIGIMSALMDEFAGMFFTSVFALPGILASMFMGVSLMVIAKGLSDIGKVLETIDPSFVDILFNEQDGIIYKLAYGFAKIGSTFSGGLLSSWLGSDPVSLGVQTVNGFGEVLSEVAGGIVSFANFSKFPIKIAKNGKLEYDNVNLWDEVAKIQENLIGAGDGSSGLLFSLASIFASIGTKFGGEGGWFGADSPTRLGIDAVSGIGGVLSEIAGGIIAFGNLANFPIKVLDKKTGKLTDDVIDLFTIVPKIQEALVGDGNVTGKVTGKSGILFALANIFAGIGNKYGDGFFSDGPVKLGVDAVSGIGGVLSGLAKGILGFAEIERGLPTLDKDGKITGYTKIDLKKVRWTIHQILDIIPSVFAGVDVGKMKAAQKKANAVLPIAETIGEIVGALKAIEGEEGKKGEGKKSYAMLDTLAPSIQKFATGIEGVKMDPETLKIIGKLGETLEKLSVVGNIKAKKFDILDTLAPSIQKFSTGIKGVTIQKTTIDMLNKLVIPLNKFSEMGAGLKVFADSLSKTGTSFQKFTGVVNGFDIEKLKLTESMMKSISVISKSPDSLAKTMSDTLEKSFAELVKAIKSIAGESGGGGGGGNPPKEDNPITTIMDNIKNPKDKGKDTGKGGGGDGAKLAQMEQMLQLLTASLSAMQKDISSMNRKITTTGDGIKVDVTP